MNQTMYDNLIELKEMLDEEYALEATWISQSNYQYPVTGIFSLHNKRTTVNSKSKHSGQLEITHAVAYFSMAPASVQGKKGDKLIVDGVTYFVLPFEAGTFETIIPLKLTENKNHNWSGYAASKA